VYARASAACTHVHTRAFTAPLLSQPCACVARHVLVRPLAQRCALARARVAPRLSSLEEKACTRRVREYARGGGCCSCLTQRGLYAHLLVNRFRSGEQTNDDDDDEDDDDEGEGEEVAAQETAHARESSLRAKDLLSRRARSTR